MKHPRGAAWLALLLAGVAAGQAALPRDRPASAQALLDAQPADRREDLLEERLVLLPSDGLPEGQVEALVLFEQPADRVWELLRARDRQREYRPELTSLAVVEQSEEGVIEEQHLKIAFLAVAYRLRNRFDAGTRTITWQLDPSFESTLEHVSGYWELHPLDAQRTLARFGTKVSVSAAVPGFLQNGITRKNVPDSLESTRQWVNSNGRWRP
jgi:ribosome-associated toxin RatA of RatAB toxin-antitoxin module